MIRLLPLFILPFIVAFNFSPMSQSIELAGATRGAQFLIENEGSTSMAVELTVKERVMDINGVETLNDTKDVMIFPPQIIIPPGEKRTVRVSYTLKDKPTKEKNYRVIAEQLPLKVDPKTKDQAGIKMLMKYVAALYASPPDTKADVKIKSWENKGKDLILTLENEGGRHMLLTNPVIKYIHKKEKGELKARDLKGLAGENILAGQKRIFKIESSTKIPKDARVELKIND